jgi:cytoskeletal protein RodZ
MSDYHQTDNLRQVNSERDGTPPKRLGYILREARAAKGLELSDVAEVTNVRKEYLKALEDGQYDELPEDVYARNFVRLYAQAIGLDHDALIATYIEERNREVVDQIEEVPPPPPTESTPPPPDRRLKLPLRTLLPSLGLAVLLIALALWGFNTLFFNPSRVTSTPPPEQGEENAPETVNTTDPEADPLSGASPLLQEDSSSPLELSTDLQTIRFSITTEPPGAEVTIDEFPLPGTTPISGAPVTARSNRVIRISLEGYESHEATYDLTEDRNLDISLTPLGAEATRDGSSASNVIAADGNIALNITETTWLEVYQSTARNVGERLVYATVNPGDTYEFSLPVYLHVGNASGVQISVSGKDLGALGSPGAVVGRAFSGE